MYLPNQSTNWKRSDSDRFILSFDFTWGIVCLKFNCVCVYHRKSMQHVQLNYLFLFACAVKMNTHIIKLNHLQELLPLRIHTSLFSAASLPVHQLLDPAGEGFAQALPLPLPPPLLTGTAYNAASKQAALNTASGQASTLPHNPG
jgi:hypothetical protein